MLMDRSRSSCGWSAALAGTVGTSRIARPAGAGSSSSWSWISLWPCFSMEETKEREEAQLSSLTHTEAFSLRPTSPLNPRRRRKTEKQEKIILAARRSSTKTKSSEHTRTEKNITKSLSGRGDRKKTTTAAAMACRALAVRSLLLPDPLHRLPAAASSSAAAPPVARAPRGGRRPHLRCCSGGGGDPGQPPQEAVLEAISTSIFLKPEIARSKGRVALTTNMVMGGTVTDDKSDEWLVLDQKVNSYPTVRGFTAIGTGGDDFVQSMVVAVESVVQESIPKGRVSQKLSSRGKYVSVNIGPIRVVSSEQVQAVYRAMRRDNRMKYFL
ncbi:hypothetical protein BAE44_0019397 [Dichanthelium oligosanthes]|uniref:Uncharacterized protein n=1 Tax=Dichanthelium oligosanthes TaxID=888268 RepID=A0A1E5V342_9POAL|nr:hypothetical protein BAE44_0019397 [Dichanthelium oligosanthes]